MTSVTLSEPEIQALRQALDNYLPELARDLSRIDRERDRHELAQVERVLTELRRRL